MTTQPNPSDQQIACDMSSAPDSPGERLAEYDRLFSTVLSERHRTATGLKLVFRAEPGVLEWVTNLSKREATCCPFMNYRVATRAEVVVWTIEGDDNRAVQLIVDEFYRLADHVGHGHEAFLTRLEVAGATTEADGPTTVVRLPN